MVANKFDVTIVGAGIIGLATALQLVTRYPKLHVGVLEKERELACHQTGHNSGVIHSGIYYKPGSLKAKNCVIGAKTLIEFCESHNVNYELCGKVIVATSMEEIGRLDELYRRGVANGVLGLELIGPERLQEIEPSAFGLKAIYSPNTGIIDYREVTAAYAKEFKACGGEILTETAVLGSISDTKNLRLLTTSQEIQTNYVVNCAGLYADRIARMMGADDDVRIIPFRGEYYMLTREAETLVRGLIYPVPNPEFPFLGVHFTRTIHGDVEAGPNAVLALAREGYTIRDVDIKESWNMLTFPGFWTMTRKYWKTGIQEWYRSLSKKAFTQALQRLLPKLEEHHLVSGGSGVRAQAVTRDGSMVDDFRITQTKYAIHVRNAPSPGATASLAISNDIVGLVEQSFELPE